MDRDLKNLQDNVDVWIKKIVQRLNKLEKVYETIDENVDNTQHNYNLIYELKDQMEEMKQDINAIKLVQIIMVKKKGETNKIIK